MNDKKEEIEDVLVTTRICKNCNVKIGYLPIDIISRERVTFNGNVKSYKVVVCPKCGKNIRINK